MFMFSIWWKSTENKARSSLLFTSANLTLMLICCTELWTRDSDQSYLLWLSGRIPWTLCQSSSHSCVFCHNGTNPWYPSSWHFFHLKPKESIFLSTVNVTPPISQLALKNRALLSRLSSHVQPEKFVFLCQRIWVPPLKLVNKLLVSCDRSLRVRSTKL